MGKNCKESSINKGTCKNCFMLELTPETKLCPVCKTSNPYISIEEVIPDLIHNGLVLYAVGFLTKYGGVSISEAVEYCANTEMKGIVLMNIHSLIEQLVNDGNPVKLIKLVRELMLVQFGWDLKQSKEFVNAMFPNMSANRRKDAINKESSEISAKLRHRNNK